jgi:hypothetical protein
MRGPISLAATAFLNNAAVAAQALRERGCSRVAVLDVDYPPRQWHAGHFFMTAATYFLSACMATRALSTPSTWAMPTSAGRVRARATTSTSRCRAAPALTPGAPALAEGLQAIARAGCDALVVSLGVDTFEADPVAGFQLRSDDYLRIGEDLAQAGLPTVFVFEGGYAVAEVGVNAVNVLEGFCQTGR